RLAELIDEHNRAHGDTRVRLELISWRTHTHPAADTDPQAAINKQIGDRYDLFVGIMWHRFGTPTPRAGSGTEEEFNLAMSRWERDPTGTGVMMSSKTPPVPLPPHQLDLTQINKVAAFRARIKSGVYFADFGTLDAFSSAVRTHLALVVQEWLARAD